MSKKTENVETGKYNRLILHRLRGCYKGFLVFLLYKVSVANERKNYLDNSTALYFLDV